MLNAFYLSLSSKFIRNQGRDCRFWVLRHLLGRMGLLEIFSPSLSVSRADQGFSEFC
jgi:hypothetical protein